MTNLIRKKRDIKQPFTYYIFEAQKKRPNRILNYI